MLVPFLIDRGKISLGNFSYFTIARLKPGATIEQARADVERMPRCWRVFPRLRGLA